MINELEAIQWITTQKAQMIDKLIAWSNINSASENIDGLSEMLSVLEDSFAPLKGKIEHLSLPPRSLVSPSGELFTHPLGKAMRITKRPDAPIRIFLAGHMDTVYSPAHPFQTCAPFDGMILNGPGVADMKGGLLIMLTALEALEKHHLAKNIGWEVLINPDEEIGSIGSEHLFREAAKRNHLGLIFEPSFADGAIVSSRKGSMNFSIVARGKAAHAGRDFDKGRNAIQALARYIVAATELNDSVSGVSINPGYIQGGGPVNIVTDLAFCRFNARAIESNDFAAIKIKLEKLINKINGDGIELSFHMESDRAPKVFDEKCRRLFDMMDECAQTEGYVLTQRPSGGVCDGNILAEEGMAVIDTLGAIGGNIHTKEEYILVDSLVQRSRLVALFLIRLATGSLILPT